MPRAVVRWEIARARPSSSTGEAFCTEAENSPGCRTNFCQEESSREFVNLRSPQRSIGATGFTPREHHDLRQLAPAQNEQCRRQWQGRGVDTGGNRSRLRLQDQAAGAADATREMRSASRGQHRRVLRAIEQCRTAALGGHRDRCDQWAQPALSYNSCRDRHCPKCLTAARNAWVAARERELLPVG
jgi:Transposase zinc-binding domain